MPRASTRASKSAATASASPRKQSRSTSYPRTQDGRYFVHKQRLWRCTNPTLDPDEKDRLVHELMDARREVGAGNKANDEARVKQARQRVQAAKEALGERGKVWWDAGEDDKNDKDWNRFMVKNTPYSTWWNALSKEERMPGE